MVQFKPDVYIHCIKKSTIFFTQCLALNQTKLLLILVSKVSQNYLYLLKEYGTFLINKKGLKNTYYLFGHLAYINNQFDTLDSGPTCFLVLCS